MNNKFKLFDSSKKKLVDIDNKSSISIYLCGPTVYNHVHIGNIRPIITYDVIHRYLLSKNISVNFVHNITDIDDKIVERSIEQNITEKELSNKYFNHYQEILDQLNILSMNMPKVSDNMDSMIEYIQKLINNKNAYFIGDDIYFYIDNLKDYGSVSNMEIDKLNIGTRVVSAFEKKTQNDFVLWKKTNEGIMWDSPIGKGRPGWHTECCVLINKFIGEQVDIHSGGIDLRFPHHENENIQNIALYNKPIAKVWNHVGHLMVKDEKMSKSLNNFIYAKDLIKMSNGNAIRWMFYQTKYEKPFNYFDKLLSESEKAIDKVERELNRAYSYLLLNKCYVPITKIDDEVIRILDDNLNTPNLVSYIYENIKSFSKNISSKNWEKLNLEYHNIKNAIELLGIKFDYIHSKENMALLSKWDNLLNDKNYKEADLMRDVLVKKKLI